MSIPTVDWDKVQEEIQRDPLLQQIEEELRTQVNDHIGFSLVDGKLMYKGRLVIPRNSNCKLMIPKEYHNTPIGGHSGDVKTHLRIAADWLWTSMRKDVSLFVQSCQECQQSKFSQQSPAGLF